MNKRFFLRIKKISESSRKSHEIYPQSLVRFSLLAEQSSKSKKWF